jgi:hypothetical protein
MIVGPGCQQFLDVGKQRRFASRPIGNKFHVQNLSDRCWDDFADDAALETEVEEDG